MTQEKINSIKKCLSICNESTIAGCKECDYHYTNTHNRKQNCTKLCGDALKYINELEKQVITLTTVCKEQQKLIKEQNTHGV